MILSKRKKETVARKWTFTDFLSTSFAFWDDFDLYSITYTLIFFQMSKFILMKVSLLPQPVVFVETYAKYIIND